MFYKLLDKLYYKKKTLSEFSLIELYKSFTIIIQTANAHNRWYT